MTSGVFALWGECAAGDGGALPRAVARRAGSPVYSCVDDTVDEPVTCEPDHVSSQSDVAGQTQSLSVGKV